MTTSVLVVSPWGIAKAAFEKLGAKNITTAVLFAKQKQAEVVFPSGGHPKRMPKVADVIGLVKHGVGLIGEAAYYKERTILGAKGALSNSSLGKRARGRHLKLKAARSHLRRLAEKAAKRRKR